MMSQAWCGGRGAGKQDGLGPCWQGDLQSSKLEGKPLIWGPQAKLSLQILFRGFQNQLGGLDLPHVNVLWSETTRDMAVVEEVCRSVRQGKSHTTGAMG